MPDEPSTGDTGNDDSGTTSGGGGGSEGSGWEEPPGWPDDLQAPYASKH